MINNFFSNYSKEKLYTHNEKKSTKIKITNQVVDKKLKSIIDISDSSLYGKKATLKLISKVNVIDSRAINSNKVLFNKSFIIDSSTHDEIIDLTKYKKFSYKWSMINIDLIVELTIDDGIFFNTKVTNKIQEWLFIKPHVSNNSKSIIDPIDNFNMLENLKAIPFDAMVLVFSLSILWWIVILVNTIIWIHDQLVSESQTYFYSHYDSDWDYSSPFFNSLATSWPLWAWIWFMIKTQLRRYMTFVFKKWKKIWDRIELYKIKDIITWKSRVDLKDIEIRVVACNMEKWQYEIWSWTKTRKISFSNPVRAVSLYNEKIDFIPKNTDICEYFKWEFSFEQMYKVLYPEQIISPTHWLTIHWEVQLIHDKFIDQELIWDSSFFKYEYFLKW